MDVSWRKVDMFYGVENLLRQRWNEAWMENHRPLFHNNCLRFTWGLEGAKASLPLHTHKLNYTVLPI